MKTARLFRSAIPAIYAAAVALAFSAALSLPAPAQSFEGGGEPAESALPAAGLQPAALIQAFNGLPGSNLGNLLNAALNLPADFRAQLSAAVAAQDAPKIAALAQVLEQKRREAAPMARTLAANDVGHISHLIETKQVRGKELALELSSAKSEIEALAAFWPEVAPEAKRIDAMAEQAALADAWAQAAELEGASASGREAAGIGSARPSSFIGFLLRHHRAKKTFAAAAREIPGVQTVRFARLGNLYTRERSDGTVVRTGPPLTVRVAYDADAERIEQQLRALLPEVLRGYDLIVEGADASISAALKIPGVLRVERALGTYDSYFGHQAFSRVKIRVAEGVDADAVREKAARIFAADDYINVRHPTLEETYEAEALKIPGVLKASFGQDHGPYNDKYTVRYTADILVARGADEAAVREKLRGVLGGRYEVSIRRAPSGRTRAR
ncbi:MAG TPA: hypothetical protein VNH15_07865 [Elusimicrobiota bacterium]|nr:hypothetical protein [Elusimicrobiota bacterium]